MNNRPRNKKNWLSLHFGELPRCIAFSAKVFHLILAAALLLLVKPSFSQQAGKTVTGVVRNNNGEPLQGVSVTVKGTSTATTTGTGGTYSIRVPSERSTLAFSFVGMTPQEQ